MPEIIAALFSLLAQAAAATNPAQLVRKRRRLRRLSDHAQGRTVQVPCDLRDRALTAGRWAEGHLELPPGGPARWTAKVRTTRAAAAASQPVDFPPLEPASVDELSVAFRSEDGATELRLHPDEAPMVLRVLRAGP
uniref:Secreted protein n=1 Tax=Streptomyces sp. NBC_00049 TaxID=2903617 RepID=A0AAU2JT33_9ACTN